MKTGKQLQQEGLAKVTQNNRKMIAYYRALALIATEGGKTISTDQLRAHAVKRNLPPLHKNAWGAIFNTKDFYCVARKASTIPSNHARYINYYTRIYHAIEPVTKAQHDAIHPKSMT